MKRPRDIPTLGSALDGALREYGLDRKVKEKEIFTRWDSIVGTAIATNAVPARFSGGTLWIRVASAAWRQELVLMREELRRTINSAIGTDLVREIVLR